MFTKLITVIKALNANASLRWRHGKIEITAGGIVGVIAVVLIVNHLW